MKLGPNYQPRLAPETLATVQDYIDEAKFEVPPGFRRIDIIASDEDFDSDIEDMEDMEEITEEVSSAELGRGPVRATSSVTPQAQKKRKKLPKVGEPIKENKLSNAPPSTSKHRDRDAAPPQEELDNLEEDSEVDWTKPPPSVNGIYPEGERKATCLSHLTGTRLTADLIAKLLVRPSRMFLEGGPTTTAMDESFTGLLTVFDMTHRLFLPQLAEKISAATRLLLKGSVKCIKASNYQLGEENLGAILTIATAMTGALLGMVRAVTSTLRPTRPLLRLLCHWDTYKTCLDRIKAHGVDLDFLRDEVVPAFDAVYLEQLVNEDVRTLVHFALSRLDLTPVAPFIRNELGSLSKSGLKLVFAMNVITPVRQVKVSLTTREQSWEILDYRLQASLYRTDPVKNLPPRKNRGGALMSENPIPTRAYSNKMSRKSKKRTSSGSPLIAKKRGKQGGQGAPAGKSTAPPIETPAAVRTRSFLVDLKRGPHGDDFTVAELQGVAGVNMAINVARAVQFHLSEREGGNNKDPPPAGEAVPPLEVIHEEAVASDNGAKEVERPLAGSAAPLPVDNPGGAAATVDRSEGEDEVPLPNPVTPSRRRAELAESSTSESGESEAEQAEQSDESTENTSDLTTDTDECDDSTFQPPRKGNEDTSSSSGSATDSSSGSSLSPKESATSRRGSRRSKANARKQQGSRAKKKNHGRAAFQRKSKGSGHERRAEPERPASEENIIVPDPTTATPILITSSADSSGAEDEIDHENQSADPRPDHVGEIRDYVARARHNANRTPNKGRRRMKLQGVTLLADSVTLRDHTAASDEEILPERYVPVRNRLWEDQNTTYPTLTLPTSEYMNAHQKALVHIIRGCETVLTALFGRQPDPEVLVDSLSEYYDQNYVKVPSSVREVFRQVQSEGTYAAKVRLYRETLPALSEKEQFHLQILMVREICQGSFLRHVIGAEDQSNESVHGVRLEEGCDFPQSFKIYSAMNRYLLHYDLGTGAELEVVNELMQRLVPGFACQAPVVLMRGGVHVASCTDSRCLLGAACLRKSSSLVGIFFEPIELAGLVGYRLSNAAARSIIRPIAEDKHNPGFHSEFIKPFENLGISTMDSNAMLYGLPRPLLTRGMPDQMLSYIHPLYPVPGVFMRIVFLKEKKDPRHPDYSGYCSKLGKVLALLRAFGCVAELLDGSGDLIVDSSSYDESLTTLLHAYATEIRMFRSVALKKPVQPTLPLFYPKIDLPAELAPTGMGQMRSNMSQSDRQELYLKLEEFLAQSPIVERYSATSVRQKRAAELRKLLQGKNPFDLHLTAKESRARLETVLDDLHRPDGSLFEYLTELFPHELSESTAGKCQVPYCHRDSCSENETRWVELVKLIKAFHERAEPWQQYPDHSGNNCRAYFPMHELQRIEKEVNRPLQQAGRPLRSDYEEPALTAYLREAGFTIEKIKPIMSTRARRVFGLYRHPGHSGRMNLFPDVFVPSAWFLEDGDFSCFVSLQISLPTSLSRRYLSLTPLNVRSSDLHHLRDGARNRGRMSF
ncbi:unnamed protein product [Oikopleura dioica]|uniref:Uncharacterized protein n=1 Tax=Oikopleura dioica TaxID=34765 RepID=E4X9I6_OIKDI|nr:unnamed protein product [Oikopleura dioica]